MVKLAVFIIGLVFGLGLCLSGMVQPAKVLGFLDLAGAWDPSLALVMGGAVAVGLVAFRVAGRRPESLLDEPMRLPQRRDLDGRLMIGALIFGIGWGISGICPGPAIAALGSGSAKAALLVVAMLAGMALCEALDRWLPTGAAQEE